MCTQSQLKPGGTKSELLKRYAKHQHSMARDQNSLITRIETVIGQAMPHGPPEDIKISYTKNFSALDHFDRDWYFIRFFNHPHDPISHFCWSLIHCAIINARAVWCAQIGKRITAKDFMRAAVEASLAGNVS